MHPAQNENVDLSALLAEIAEHGAPAHRRHAEELQSRLDHGESPASLQEDVFRLADAYRNDPYLWR